MIYIRKATLDDIEELATMYYDLIETVYPNRKRTSIANYYKNVIIWFQSSWDISLSVKDDTITGFTVGYLDDFGGVIEPYYKADISYVKPEYRGGRSAYMLYHNLNDSKKEFLVETTASVSTGSSKLASRFGYKTFITYEREAL